MPLEPSLRPLLLRSVALGAAAGARATLGVAAPALAPVDAPGAAPAVPVAPTTVPTVPASAPGVAARGWRTAGRLVAGLAVVGELVGDKLPRTPSRLAGSGPAGRAISGAVGGVLLARRRGPGTAATLAASAVAGAAGAAAGTWGGAAWRGLAGDHGPDWPYAAAEDAAAILLALWATRY